MKNKKKIIIIIITIVALVIVIGLTYAVWSKNYIQPDKNTMIANCFDISYKEEKEITMTNMYPQRDEEGLTNEAYKVTIENTCEMPISYKVKLRLIESSLNKEYIKVGVGTNIVTLSEVPKEGELYLIREDILAWKGKRIIDIRSWMEENTPMEEGQNKSYRYQIEIEGTSYNGTKRYLAKEITSQNKVQEEVPDFSHASPEVVDGVETDYGKGLFATEDDDGTSYYFRGAVDNNNVQFADMDWKILRINGDGSIRLILKGTVGTKSAFNANTSNDIKFVGYTFDNEHACTQGEPCVSDYDTSVNRFTSNYGDNNIKDSTIKKFLEDWYIQNIVQKGLNDKVALSSYCNDTSIPDTDFGGRARFGSGNPSLKCPNPIKSNSEDTQTYGGVYKLKIGLITSDEANFLGCVWKGKTGTLFVSPGGWTMTPFSIGGVRVFYFGGGGSYDNRRNVSEETDAKPVINLKSDVTFTGSGTTENPYIIN